MLRIRQEKHLARTVELDVPAHRRLAESAESYCEELLLHDPAKPTRDRRVLDVHGDLKRVQRSIFKRIILPNLKPSDESFGGVRGRHIKMNAEQHLRSRFAYSCDITDFYPSIRYKRVYDFFTNVQKCSPDVARLLTRLCTYRYHLALGLITSPLLADQFLKPVDARIAKMAKARNLVYTRYVDDITISGAFDLARSGFPEAIKRILNTNGFATNNQKDQFGRVGDPEMLITKLRINRGHIDVSRRYYDKLCVLLANLQSLGEGGDFPSPYYTSAQVRGRIEFVSWVNRGRRPHLMKLYRAVDWKRVRIEAEARGLVVCKKTLRPIARVLVAACPPTQLSRCPG